MSVNKGLRVRDVLAGNSLKRPSLFYSTFYFFHVLYTRRHSALLCFLLLLLLYKKGSEFWDDTFLTPWLRHEKRERGRAASEAALKSLTMEYHGEKRKCFWKDWSLQMCWKKILLLNVLCSSVAQWGSDWLAHVHSCKSVLARSLRQKLTDIIVSIT